MVTPAELYRRIDLVRVAPRRWRLQPVANNGHRFPEFRTYVTLWNAKRACRRRFPDVPIAVVREVE